MAYQVKEQQFDQARNQRRWLFRIAACLKQDQVKQRGGSAEGGRIAAYQQIRRKGIDDEGGQGAAKLEETAGQCRGRTGCRRLQRQHRLRADGYLPLTVGAEDVREVAP